MLCHDFCVLWVVFGYVRVEMDEVVLGFSKELKFEFVVNFDYRVDPVHFRFKL